MTDWVLRNAPKQVSRTRDLFMIILHGLDAESVQTCVLAQNRVQCCLVTRRGQNLVAVPQKRRKEISGPGIVFGKVTAGIGNPGRRGAKKNNPSVG